MKKEERINTISEVSGSAAGAAVGAVIGSAVAGPVGRKNLFLGRK